MRIATSQYQATMNRGLNFNQDHISKINEQMASGNKIQLPSDDPVTNVRLSRLTREQAIVTQYRNNISSTQIRLQKNETYLTSVSNDIVSVKDLLVWASDGSNASDDLGSMVNSLTALRDSMLYSANEKDQEGRYIFSGTLTDTPAISYDETAPVGSRYSYTGNTSKQQVVVGNGITQAANVDVSGMETFLNQIDTAIEQLGRPGVVAGDADLVAALKAAMDGADSTLNMVSGKIAEFGGAQNILSTLDGNHANVSLSNETAMNDLGQLDYGLAATELNGYTLALQASYKAYAKVSDLSLFSVI
ncbi:flagellar hook-associated protein FlgL [Oxalobacteraceae bacterium A2-2]